MGIHRFFHSIEARFLAEIAGLQLTEVVVRISMVERQDEIDEGAPTA